MDLTVEELSSYYTHLQVLAEDCDRYLKLLLLKSTDYLLRPMN
jgi:hypothetical protein